MHDTLGAARARLARRDAEVLRAQVAVSEIPAPTGDEAKRGAWIARRFHALGLTGVHMDAAGNVIGRRAGATELSDEAPVVVCAHLDTVFPRGTPLRVRREGSLFTGPGIGDNGRGLAVMLELALELADRSVAPMRCIDFVATTGEEGAGDLRGAKHYFAESVGGKGGRGGRAPVAVIALDGAGDERVIHRALGARRFRIAYGGSGGHSWAAYGVPNAVHAAAIAGARIAALALPAEPRTTLSVGRIGGGISVNAIPAEGWLEVDLRSTSGAVLERFDAELRALARAAGDDENSRRATGTPPLSVTVDVIGDRPCGETDARHPLVLAAMQATRLIGREPELTSASTDANVPISLGIPAIALGAGGRGGEAHTTGEWFDNTDGTLGIARALTVVAAAAGVQAAGAPAASLPRHDAVIPVSPPSFTLSRE